MEEKTLNLFLNHEKKLTFRPAGKFTLHGIYFSIIKKKTENGVKLLQVQWTKIGKCMMNELITKDVLWIVKCLCHH